MIHLGAAVAVKPLRADARYRNTLARAFTMVTAENVMKFGPVHPAPARYDFRGADAIVRFATARRMAVRGHTLVWHSQQPVWLTGGRFSRRALAAVLRAHIRTVAGRYRGRIAAWDVVNEAVADDGTPRRTLWSAGLGPGYLEQAFAWANEADPVARLFYNDYGIEALGRKSDAVYRLAERLLARGAPLHGVGFQAHLGLDDLPRWRDVEANLRRFAALGLLVQVTELDVRIPGKAGRRALARQADAYRRLLEICLTIPTCTAFVTWGFTDRHSWVPNFFKGYGAALPFDASYRPKPAMRAVQRLLGR